MYKPSYGLCALACMISINIFAADAINLRGKPISALQTFTTDKHSVSFEEVQSDIDFNQTKHVRLQQTYAGYPIWGADIVVHIPNGMNKNLNTLIATKENNNITMNGVIYNNLTSDLSEKSNYNNHQADKAMQNTVMHYQQRYAYTTSSMQKKSQEIIYIDHDKHAHWAYLISFSLISKDSIPTQPTFIIDANTFVIYQTWDNLKTISSSLGGGYGGNEKTGKIIYDGLKNHFSALDIRRDSTNNICYLANHDVVVKDASHNNEIINFQCSAVNHDHGDIYWNTNRDAINGAYSPGDDALFIGKIVKEMYQKWYQIPVLTTHDKPMILNMLVHLKMDNAYWDGHRMAFGDGGELFYPLVSLGVGAHEISHGFTQQHANLVYFGQSGALNEAFSDMAAQAALYYATQHNNWLIGDEILKQSNTALRYMDEPTKDCVNKLDTDECSINHVKDYKDSLDVHYASGVFNKFFYLIATATGWDTHKAFDVMVLANQHYWTSTSHFIDAACGVMQAAKDYHYSLTAIKNAAKQVGIDIEQC